MCRQDLSAGFDYLTKQTGLCGADFQTYGLGLFGCKNNLVIYGFMGVFFIVVIMLLPFMVMVVFMVMLMFMIMM